MKHQHLSSLIIISILLLCSCNNGNKESGLSQGTKDSTGSIYIHQKPNIVEPRAAFDTLRDGDFTMRYASGVIQMRGYYMGGKREGQWTAFFPTGKVQSEGFFTHGRRDHKAVVYYESGKKYYEGTYKDGVMVGIWKYYNPDGSLSKEINCGDKKE
jgi:antitoxin component YwqK of YwqJK toxin-antitoxin module